MRTAFLLRKILVIIALFTSVVCFAQHKYTLVIDPGHGGKDHGAPGKLTNEKTINLRIAKAFGRLVENNCPDVKVIYTRKTDHFVPLQTRASIANNAKADLFISIHTNSLPKGRIAHGTETYTLGMHRAGDNLDVAKRENSVITYETDYKTRYQGFDPNRSESYVIFEFIQDKHMKESVDLASHIQRYYARGGRPVRGVRQAGFLVLRETSMPSVLTEVGFISTPSEERFLHSTKGVNIIARAIYNGFVNYRKSHKTTAKATPPAPSTKTSASPQRKATTPEYQNKHYRVQFTISNKRLSTKDRRFRGIEDIDVYKSGRIYKYTSGHYKTRKEATRAMLKIRKKYKDAFVVTFDGDTRVK